MMKKTALITGGGSGLGKSIALSLAADGIDIIICGRNKKTLEDVAGEIRLLNRTVKTYVLDATDSHQVKGLFSDEGKIHDKLDILVNNIGGVEKFDDFFHLTDDDWSNSYLLNFMTMVYFCREAIQWLKKSKQGRIINISTIAAKQPGLYNPHYSSAKAAMLHLSKHLSNILAKDNILVNTICASTLAGGSWERNIQDRAKRLNISYSKAKEIAEKEEKEKNPLKRIGNLSDVAYLVTFLASEKANFITGSCIDVDGGTVRSIL